MKDCVDLADPALGKLMALINWDLFWSKVDLGEHEYNCMLWQDNVRRYRQLRKGVVS